MSSSEADFSEGSNLETPHSHRSSPYSSPSQQVPHLASVFSGITCDDIISMHPDGKQRPYLRIVEQPQNYFRFRYKSEMVGTHGCLLGRSTNASKTKTHPTVELVNYTGQAVIRCRLAQADNDDEHPHKLFEDEQEDRDVSAMVPEQSSYKVGFAGMGIIHTAKKDVPGLLYKKYMDRSPKINAKELRAHCENTAKSINLNIVRLRFSAHDLTTDKEICLPAFSEPIHNMKSAAVNDLKICRISRYCGRSRGGEDVFLLVEKVNKKNITVRLFELDENGAECWSAPGVFLLSDVHHQYAIVFRTPPYKDPHITKDVKVFIELKRPSDGRTSEPKEFVYKKDPIIANKKRKRVNSSFTSLESSSSGSIKSMSDVPTVVEMITVNNEKMDPLANVPPIFQIHIPQAPAIPTNDLADALFYNTAKDYKHPNAMNTMPTPSSILPTMNPIPTQSPMLATHGPMMGQLPQMPEPPVIELNSTEFDRILNHEPAASQELKKFYENDFLEYMQSFGDSVSGSKANSMDFLRSSMQLVADSGRGKGIKKELEVEDDPMKSNAEKCKGGEYTAYYKAEEGNEVRRLVKEICDLIKNKNGYKKQEMRSKLERMFEIRLSNGDAFLHMTLNSNQPSFDFIVKLIHTMKMTHLLNLTNDQQQTILHLAIRNDLPRVVTQLVAKGCDPMLGDKDGNNAVHYAVMCQACLHPLLNAIKQYDIACDLNAYNFEKQTALHLAAIYGSESCTRLLLQHGASYNARDSEGRAPLHLAVYDDCAAVCRALADNTPPSDIDAEDGRGITALQIVCSATIRKHSLEIVKLLLEKKADPLKHTDHNEPPWRMAVNKPLLWNIMKAYVPQNVVTEDEIKSEPEDEYESADEGEYSGLCELPLYKSSVAPLLDASGAWRALASRLRADAPLSWFERTPSPTSTLLMHLKESGDNLTSKALALHLQEMGELEAAAIIRRYISD